jgi:hypothetical protein
MIDDEIDMIEDKTEQEQLLSLLGENSFIDTDSKKVGRNCEVTTMYFFKDYNLYLKEIQTGECHYKDVAIDGGCDSIEYFICEAVPSVSYKEIKQIEV